MRASFSLGALRRAVSLTLMVALLSAASGESSKQRTASILARVLSYELTLEDRVGESVGIAIVYQRENEASSTSADEWLKGFAELSTVKIKSKPLVALKVPYDTGELSAAIDRGVDVLWVASGLGAETPTIARLARSKRVLTASSATAYAQTDLTLCLTEEEKPKIFINLNAARLEGIQFSSRLLSLATLIR